MKVPKWMTPSESELGGLFAAFFDLLALGGDEEVSSSLALRVRLRFDVVRDLTAGVGDEATRIEVAFCLLFEA